MKKMSNAERAENDFRHLGSPCPSCRRKPFLVLFSHGGGFVTCASQECIDRNARVETGNNFDYGDAIGRAMRAWQPIVNRKEK